MHTPSRLAEPSGEPAWRLDAACQQGDVHFSPPQPESSADRRAREQAARAMCEVCPVRSPCLAFALAGQERWGIWGGLTWAERRRLLRSRAAGTRRAR